MEHNHEPGDARRRREAAALGLLAAVASACLITWFWPGSIGADFDVTLAESAAGTYAGHQPPSAAVATWALSFGTSEPAVLLVVKVLAYFMPLVLLIASKRVPIGIPLGAAVILLSPEFLYHAPLLRSNGFELAFTGIAIAASVAKRNRLNSGIALCSLVVAMLFSNGVNPGLIALVPMYSLWHEPRWRFARHAGATLAPMFILAAAIFLVGRVTGNVDRSHALYVSALNGIGGLALRGVDTPCLSQSVVRGSAIPPARVFVDHYARPHIVNSIWFGEIGFEEPGRLSAAQRWSVMHCWRQLAAGNPAEFLRERADLARITATAGRLDPHFYYVKSSDGLRLNAGFDQYFDAPRGAREIIKYGVIGDTAGLNSFVPYLLAFLLATGLSLALVPPRRLFTVMSVVVVLGLSLPQLLFAQGTMFRYYLTPSFAASWFVLLQGWILWRRWRSGANASAAA